MSYECREMQANRSPAMAEIVVLLIPIAIGSYIVFGQLLNTNNYPYYTTPYT